MIVSDGMASLGKVIVGDGDAVGAPGLELHPLPLLALCQAHVVSLKSCLNIILAPTLFPLVRPASVALAGKEVKAEVEWGELEEEASDEEGGRGWQSSSPSTTIKMLSGFKWLLFTCAGLVRLTVSDAVVAVFKARLEGKLVSVRGFWWVL